MVARVSGLCFVVDCDWIVLLFVLGFWCVLLLRGGCFGFAVWGGCSCSIVVGWFAALRWLVWCNVLRFRLA